MTASDFIAPAPAKARLGFRLRTLLLMPLLVGVVLGPVRLLAGRLDGLVPLYVISGAVFGSYWAVDRMRVIGRIDRGFRRVFGVTWAAMCGGFTSGLLVGPVNLMVAVSRELSGGMQGDIVSLVLGGSWLGATLGAAGGALAGPLFAYAYLAIGGGDRQVDVSRGGGYGRSDGLVTWCIVWMLRSGPGAGRLEDCSGSQELLNVFQRCARAVVPWVRRAVYVLILAVPTIWLAGTFKAYFGEAVALRQLRRSGLTIRVVRTSHQHVGPRWVLPAFGGFFSRVDTLRISGPLAQIKSAVQETPLSALNELRQVDIIARQANDCGRTLRELAPVLATADAAVSLDLAGSDMSDGDLVHLASLDVERLVLDRTRITDAGLQELASMPALRHLSLCATDVTDAGLTELQGLPSLEQLSLRGTAVTEEGLGKFHEAFTSAAPVAMGATMPSPLPPERWLSIDH